LTLITITPKIKTYPYSLRKRRFFPFKLSTKTKAISSKTSVPSTTNNSQRKRSPKSKLAFYPIMLFKRNLE
jgi:hypothetical protein